MAPLLEEILTRPDLDLRRAHDLLLLLAALARKPGETDLSRVAELVARDLPTEEAWARVTEDLDEYLGVLIADLPPVEPPQAATWLEEAETLGLALLGVSRVPAPDQPRRNLAVGLAERVERMKAGLAGRSDLWVLRGRVEDAAVEAFPWSAVPRPADLLGGMSFDSATQQWAVARWLAGDTDSEVGRVIRDAVLQRRPWRDAYLSELDRVAKALKVASFDDAWTTLLGDLGVTWTLFSHPLPHRGAEVALVVTWVPGGTEWRLGDDVERVPLEIPEKLVEDDVVSLCFKIKEEPAAAWLAVTRVLAHVGEWEELEEDSRARGRLLCRELTRKEGPLYSGLAAASRLFEEGEAEGESPLVEGALPASWASACLELRAQLESLSVRCNDDAFRMDLAEVDAELRPLERGLLLLDDGTVADLLRGVVVDPDAWWGIHKRLRDAPDVGADVWSDVRRAQREVTLLAADETTLPPDGKPAPWLAAGAGDVPFPGRIPVLLVGADDGVGYVGELRVEIDADLPSDQLGPSAMNALRGAHRSAARAMTGGPAPALDQHRFLLLTHRGDAVVDGESLALSGLLAMVSLWTDTALPANLVASARVRGEELMRVEGLEEKLQALESMVANAPRALRVLVATRQDVTTRPGSLVEVVSLGRVAEAVRVAGLDRSARLVTAVPPVTELKGRLAEVCADVRRQHRTGYGGDGLNPWIVMGDRITSICHLLAGKVRGEQLQEALVDAALAYSHAGAYRETGEVFAMLESLGEAPPVVAAFRAALAVERATESGDMTQLELLIGELQAAQEALPESEADVRGILRSQQGRGYAHLRKPKKAIPLLRDVVEAHRASHLLAERARSRIYLAHALRLNGEYVQAYEELEGSRQDLEEHTKPFDRSYYATTRMYWNYECARLAVERGDGAGGRAHATNALAALGPYEWWPKVGILRTLAWACYLTGDHDGRQGALRSLDRTVEAMDRELRPFGERLLAEARGRPLRTGESGEIY